MSASSNIGFKINLTNMAAKAFNEAELSKILSQELQQAADDARSNVPVQTGNLQRSIGYTVNGLKGELFAGAEYAQAVEFGHVTKGGSMVSGRPYLRPAAEDAHKRLPAKIKAHVDRALRSSTSK